MKAEDEYSLIESFDKQLVEMDVTKESSQEYFHYTTEYLGGQYTQRILENPN